MTVRSVLLLAKPYPLSFGLEGAVRGTGNRFLAIYERPRSASRVIKSTLRRHGWLKTADILAYSLYERIFRRAEIGAAMAGFTPMRTDTADRGDGGVSATD